MQAPTSIPTTRLRLAAKPITMIRNFPTRSFSMLAICALLLTLAADPIPKETGTPRKPHPLAPSLPELTDKEEAELDRAIDRFIQADTGKLAGADAKKAMAE